MSSPGWNLMTSLGLKECVIRDNQQDTVMGTDDSRMIHFGFAFALVIRDNQQDTVIMDRNSRMIHLPLALGASFEFPLCPLCISFAFASCTLLALVLK